LQLADDLDELPVQINATISGAGGAPPSSLKLDLTTVEARTPPDSDFEVPDGFKQASSPAGVLGRGLP
jgi:hypothetical protein